MDKRKLAIASVSMIILASLIAYAAIQYFGQVGVIVPVEQSVLVDGKLWNQTITETLPLTYGGCTVYSNHTLENRGDDNAQVKFEVVNITDSQGNQIGDGVEVYFLVGGERVVTAIIHAHSAVGFSIAIHFHYAIMPDTYTVYTQVKPFA